MQQFTAEDRRRLVAGLRAGREPSCPACGADLKRSPVQRPDGVSYVRHRVWLVCPACKRSAAVDVPR
jgi:hypothetical protein